MEFSEKHQIECLGMAKGKNSVRDDYKRNREHHLSAYKLSFATSSIMEMDLGHLEKDREKEDINSRGTNQLFLQEEITQMRTLQPAREITVERNMIMVWYQE